MSLQKTWGNIHLTALGAMMLSFLLVGCDDSVAQNAAPPAPTVSAAKVLVKSISQWDSFNGRIEAVESVQLRPRVSGYIDKVNYTDGQEVKKGQVLFTIDDRTYRAALEQAQAALARAKTQASLAQSEANRTDKLVHTNLVSREEWEQRRSAAVQAQADIRAAQAAVDAAQLNLDFTKVTAPIDGRASRALITSGNLVTAGDTASVLTTPWSRKRRCTSTLTSTSQPTSTIKTSPAAGKARPAIIRRSRWRLAWWARRVTPTRAKWIFSIIS
ncbi:oqxA [Klebsiella pneumoniae]|nr:oqxA [Klebsiella pneumoniae]